VTPHAELDAHPAMPRHLILMRHGHAEELRDDFARRLTEEGRAAARRAGQALRAAHFSPQRIVTSSAPRARETAELVAEQCGYGGVLQSEQALYLAEEGPYLSALRALPDALSRVLLVGHNPTLSALSRTLGEAGTELRPADYVELRLELASWQDL
jgi:phosphohistidine phosphatase